MRVTNVGLQSIIIRDVVREEDMTPPETFDDFYRREYRSVLGLATVLSGDRSLAEDLTQEAMIEAHRRWAKISQYDDPGAWVRRVLANKSTSRWRRATTESKGLHRLMSRRQDDRHLDPETDEMFRLVRQLPARQAQTVALRYWEDRSVKEIATILELGEETVKTHLKRGLAKLETLLQNGASS